MPQSIASGKDGIVGTVAIAGFGGGDGLRPLVLDAHRPVRYSSAMRS